MFTSEPKNAHEAFKPLLYVNCFAGMGAFRLPNQSAAVYSYMKLHTVIISIFNWTATYLALNSIAIIEEFFHSSSMVIMMYEAILITSSLIIAIMPLLVWLRRKGLRDSFRQMPILDETFRVVFGARNEYRRQYIRLIRQMIVIFLFTCLVSISLAVTSLDILLQMEIRSVLLFCSIAYIILHAILVMLLLDVNFYTFVGYLGKKFRDMNDSLVGLTGQLPTSRPGERLFIVSKKVRPIRREPHVKNTEAESVLNDKHHLLREIRKAHLEICKLSRKLNLAFGIQNLLSTGISFAMITGLLYTIYSALSSKNFTNSKLREVIPPFLWATIHAFKIWMVNHSCWRVSNEAERTSGIIYELLDSRVDKELQREIEEFAVQMLQNPVRFNACGFFTLDYTFVQGVIGSITTYLVILIQMSQTSESSISNSLVNETEIQAMH